MSPQVFLGIPALECISRRKWVVVGWSVFFFWGGQGTSHDLCPTPGLLPSRAMLLAKGSVFWFASVVLWVEILWLVFLRCFWAGVYFFMEAKASPKQQPDPTPKAAA